MSPRATAVVPGSLHEILRRLRVSKPRQEHRAKDPKVFAYFSWGPHTISICGGYNRVRYEKRPPGPSATPKDAQRCPPASSARSRLLELSPDV
jgi:hypothetical protein